MKTFKKYYLLVAFIGLFVTNSTGQNYRIQNSIGVYGGLTQFNIDTDDLTTESGSGWLVGLAATVDLPHRWYNVSYNIQLAENQFGVGASPISAGQTQFVDYKVFTAQIALIGHLKIIDKYLTIDVGPMLQYNGDLDIQDETKESYIIDGYNTATLNDLPEVAHFNVNAAVGATLGFDSFKVRAQYIYGFLNSFKSTNNQNLAESINIEGNQNMLVFSAMFLF